MALARADQLLTTLIRFYVFPHQSVMRRNIGATTFMRRLARAHINCIEGLPIFGGLLAIAMMTSRAGITDSLAFWFLGARIVQSIIHLVSTNSTAVSLRFAAFAVQMAIGVYWSLKLII
jgi:uncharacterized MAPEG superfamily protein